MSRFEYLLASIALSLVGRLFDLMPRRPRRIVLASPRKDVLDGNLLAIQEALRSMRPGTDVVALAEPYAYGVRGKVAYALRVIRGTYHLRTAGLVIVDNAWLPVHVAPHPAATVVQVWHAVGALKRFGVDSVPRPVEPERTFLHRYYDWVITAGEASRGPWSRALRTPLERVLALGAPRTDALLDPAQLAASRSRIIGLYPELAGRRVITYAPTFRGRGRAKRPATGLDAMRLRAALSGDDVLVLKTHPNLDRRLVNTSGYDVVVDPREEMNDLLAMTDILITDYSSSIFEYALLRRPLVLLVGDLDAYERQPGVYLDVRRDMIGTHVSDTDGVIAAIRADAFDLTGYDAFVQRHLAACDGHASRRFVDRFVPADGRR